MNAATAPSWRKANAIAERWATFHHGNYPNESETHDLLRRAGFNVTPRRPVTVDGRPTPHGPEPAEAVEVPAARLVEGSISSTPHPKPEAALRLERRGWSGQYRLRLDPNLGPGRTPPPENLGDRVTVRLSKRGERVIGDACAYVLAKRGGFQTFATLTFTAEQRAKLAAGETTVQRELHRFLDGLAKMRRRGWRPAYERRRTITPRRDRAVAAKHRRPRELTRPLPPTHYTAGAPYVPLRFKQPKQGGQITPLDYVWVAENPLNDQGERNPHVHLLIRWRVSWALFPCWAHRIEKSLWANGYAHLERIRKRAAAGYYIAKAAGYLSKAASSEDQGPVKGNRYGVSKSARAPGWDSVAVAAADLFPELMPELLQHATAKRGPLLAQRARLRERIAAEPKANRQRRQNLGRALAHVRGQIDALGVYMTRAGVILTGWRKVRRLLAWLHRRGTLYAAKPKPWDLTLWEQGERIARAVVSPIFDLWHLIPDERADSRADTLDAWSAYAT